MVLRQAGRLELSSTPRERPSGDSPGRGGSKLFNEATGVHDRGYVVLPGGLDARGHDITATHPLRVGQDQRAGLTGVWLSLHARDADVEESALLLHLLCSLDGRKIAVGFSRRQPSNTPRWDRHGSAEPLALVKAHDANVFDLGRNLRLADRFHKLRQQRSASVGCAFLECCKREFTKIPRRGLSVREQPIHEGSNIRQGIQTIDALAQSGERRDNSLGVRQSWPALLEPPQRIPR